MEAVKDLKLRAIGLVLHSSKIKFHGVNDEGADIGSVIHDKCELLICFGPRVSHSQQTQLCGEWCEKVTDCFFSGSCRQC